MVHMALSACSQELLEFEFDYRYMMRGLIIDKRRGNVLKMDRHKYVKVAFHGFRPLSREERLATYANSLVGGVLKRGCTPSRPCALWQTVRTGLRAAVHARPHGRGDLPRLQAFSPHSLGLQAA